MMEYTSFKGSKLYKDCPFFDTYCRHLIMQLIIFYFVDKNIESLEIGN